MLSSSSWLKLVAAVPRSSAFSMKPDAVTVLVNAVARVTDVRKFLKVVGPCPGTSRSTVDQGGWFSESPERRWRNQEAQALACYLLLQVGITVPNDRHPKVRQFSSSCQQVNIMNSECISGHRCARPHTSTRTALIGVLAWALDLSVQSRPNEWRMAECHCPLVHRRAGRATHSPCRGQKPQLQCSPLLCFWQPNARDIISTKTDNFEREGSKFCIYYSCLLESKENVSDTCLLSGI